MVECINIELRDAYQELTHGQLNDSPTRLVGGAKPFKSDDKVPSILEALAILSSPGDCFVHQIKPLFRGSKFLERVKLDGLGEFSLARSLDMPPKTKAYKPIAARVRRLHTPEAMTRGE